MKRNISEDLPERKFAPAAAGGSPQGKSDAGSSSNKEGGSSEKTPEKKAKQAVYDIRYRARREDIPLRQAFSQYMQNSSLGQTERTFIMQNLFGKEGGGMKAEDYNAMFANAASDSISSALYKVFVEGKNQNQDPIQLTYFEELENSKERKYEIKVTDKNSGKTYIRLATREKINNLRANPNISEVEIISVDPTKVTAYGDPYEGERKRGSQTAAVTSGKGLDYDYDGDGKVESGAKEYRGSVHNAIQRKKGGTPDGRDTSSVKEDFIHEAGKKKVDDDVEKTFDVMPPNKKNTVKVCPENGNGISESGYSKFLKKVNTVKEEAVSQNQQQLAGMALAFLRGDMPDASEEVKKMAKMGEKELLKFAKTKHEGLPEKVKEEAECNSDDSKEEEDPRSMKTKINLVKNKLRAMGLKMSYEPEGDQIDEFFGPDKVVPKGGQISGSKDPVEVGRDYVAQSGGKPAVVNYDKAGSKTVRPFTQQDNLNRRKNTLAQNAAAASMGMSPLYNVRNSYEPEGEMVDEAKVDDDLSPLEKQNARNKRSGNSTFTRQNLTKIYRGKSTRGMKPSEPTDDLSDEEKERAREEKERARAAMTSVRKYEMALNQPNTPVGKRVRGEIEMNKAELGPSGRRGS